MNKNSETARIVKQWVDHAEEDLRLARFALKITSSCPHKLIAFHAQQCAEKYLKAFLALKKVDFPYSHNISLLVELCSPHAGWINDLQGIESLTPYAITARYPGKYKVTKKEAVQAVELASIVRKAVRKALIQETM